MIPEHLPHRHTNTIVAAFDDAYVVFDPRCNDVHLIESLSAVIFDACDGSPTADLVADITEILGLDVARAENAVLVHLEEFGNKGLLVGTQAPERPP